MKKTLKEVIKMAAFYASVGFIIQILFWNLIIASTPVAAQNLRNIKLSVNVNNVKLEKALQVIESKTNFVFSYLKDEIPIDEFISINCKEESLYNVLCDLGKEIGLNFSRINDYIIVKKGAGTEDAPITVIEYGSIKGKVTDKQTREAISGATIQIKGINKGCITNNNGYFEINKLKNGQYTITASMIGYAPIERTVTILDNKVVEADFQMEQKDIDMNEILVTASTVLPTPVKKLPNAITVVTPREIESINAPNAADLIRLTVPGAIYTQEGAGTTYGSFSVRGVSSVAGSASTMKIYIDGVESCDPSYVTYLDPATIERMEVIPGPQASTIYGAGAISGVTQIFTKHGTAGNVKLSGKVGLTSVDNKYTGSNHPLGKEMDLNASGGYPFMTYNLGVHYRTEAAWLSLFEQNNLGLTGASNFNFGNFSGSLSLNYSKLDGTSGENPIYKQLYSSIAKAYSAGTELSQTEYQTYGLTLSYKLNDNWFHNLTLGYNDLNSSSVSRIATSGKYTASESKTRRYTASYNTSYQMKLNDVISSSLTLGTDWTQYSHPSFSGKVDDRDNYDFIDQNPGYVINSGFFGQTQISLYDFIYLTGGLRADKNPSGTNKDYTWSPRIGLSSVYEVEKWMVKGRISWGQSIVIPDATEINGKIGTTYIYLPNPDLKSEVQKGWEIGTDVYYSNILSVGLTYFNQKPTNLIELVTVGATSSGVTQYQYQNVDEVKNEGFEIKAVSHPFNWLTVNLNYGKTKSTIEQLGSSYIGGRKVGDQLSGLPKYTLSANFEIMPFDGTSILLSAFQFGDWVNTDIYSYYHDAYTGHYNKATKPYPSGYYITYPAYTKINIGINQRITKLLTVYLQINNLTNTEKFERINIIMTQPRTIICGVKFSGLTL